MTQLVAKVSATQPGEYWSNFDIADVKNVDGKPLVAQQFIYLNFKSPAAPPDNDIQVEPWVDATCHVDSTRIDDTHYDVTVKIVPKNPPFTPGQPVHITIGVGGDLRDGQQYFDTFVLYTDEEPDLSGTVITDVAACPDPTLANLPVVVEFDCGARHQEAKLAFGKKQDVKLPNGTYTVTAQPVSTEGNTVSAPVLLSPSTVTVNVGQSVPLAVTFGKVVKQGAIDVTISDSLATELGTEMLAVEVVDKASGSVLASFDSKVGPCTPVRALQAGANVDVRVRSVALNNVDYAFKPQSFTLGTELAKATFDSSSVKRTPVDTTGFIAQKVKITVDSKVPGNFLLRLIGKDMDYAANLAAEGGTVTFPSVLEPGSYKAEVSNFLFDGSVYYVDATPAEFDASASAPLAVGIERGATLDVPGFPAFLSFGACANLTPTNIDDFSAARASAIFKYAGDDGAGNDQTYLDDDLATKNTIKVARSIEAKVGGKHRVLPVMISYTCNLSQGATVDILLDADRHKHSYANYVLALSLAVKAADADHPVSAAFLVNADFLGACQQAGLHVTGPISGSQAMPVRAPLNEAIKESVKRGWLPAPLDIPADITEDINGYVRSVNWLTRAVAGTKVSLGWISNLWGVGSSFWMYGDADVTQSAQSTADYAISAGVFEGAYGADFHAIDRYEADDLTQRANINGYCYGPHEWRRYYDFCAAMSRRMKKPVMPWQIPASRLPTTEDAVGDFETQHWGTEASYLFGHPEIGSDMNNINATVLKFTLPGTFPPPYKTVSDLFTREPFDLGKPAYGDFPLRGIFSVLLGGGATTGMVRDIGTTGPWAGAKVNAYMNSPIPFR